MAGMSARKIVWLDRSEQRGQSQEFRPIGGREQQMS